MKKYPKYKDSGIEWIGEIPEHWENAKVKFLVEGVFTGTTPTTSKKDYFENGHFNWYTPGDFYVDELNISERKVNQFAIDDNEINIYKENSVFFVGIGATIGKVAISPKKASCNQQLNVLTFNQGKIYPKFGFFLTKIIAKDLIKWASFTTLPIFNQSKTKDLDFIVPNLPEQTTIANYLDQKTAQIDETIGKKERLIELLEEERKAIINHAVTKGINPDVKLKPSGIEWLGDIPEHWEIVRIKRIAKIRYGLGQPPKQLDGGLPIIRATNVERGKINIKELVFVDPDDIPYERDPVLKENDIIVVRSGAYTADSAIIPKEFEGAITGYDMVLTPYGCNPKLMSYALLSNYLLVNQLFLLRLRAAQPHLNAEELGDSFVLLPPKQEQLKIVELIEDENERICNVSETIKKEIELLKEYRQALIFEAVTGKIDVRN